MSQIRRERVKAGLTQAQVAERTGLKQTTVSQIEIRGSGEWESIKAIARVLAEAMGEGPEQVLGRFGEFDAKAGAL